MSDLPYTVLLYFTVFFIFKKKFPEQQMTITKLGDITPVQSQLTVSTVTRTNDQTTARFGILVSCQHHRAQGRNFLASCQNHKALGLDFQCLARTIMSAITNFGFRTIQPWVLNISVPYRDHTCTWLLSLGKCHLDAYMLTDF